ncbi:uncharacterized protein LOC115878912 [Sitophilus oryzae]|uniref:Uncharacterized protein LOC115878912 n=1 Tax=Sitophilus oryzae TaxID=7048 RepID=A0A6J2XJB4_SITOR|nr:uncharacterized protein LOC115878912 [Sitophilus oryzae]
MSQYQSFSKEYVALKNHQTLPKTSKLLCLKPFIDETGFIRVGGRIRNAQISDEQKYPIVLSNKCALTKIIMMYEHSKLLHCGPQQLLYNIRLHYWPLCGRRLARSVVRNCVTCFRANPVTFNYIMGDLPECRVSSFQPVFSHTGIDYAGPIFIRDRKTRNSKTVKGYICIFVCMSTKCIHLDIVTDLTSQAFLSVLKRFVSRRGKPLHLYSDNGTTFIGANSAMLQFINKHSNYVSTCLATEGIQWHFMPPKAPNFGGLWEAGVKSVKYHLKRIIRDTSLTYEDLSTVLVQIEGVLNSRPLSPLSSDPQDLTPLTQAHFLIGRPLTAVPEDDVSNILENRLSNYQRQQKMVQQFWNREYISNLQTRTKWFLNHLVRVFRLSKYS